MPDFFYVVSEYCWVGFLAFSVFNYWKADRNAVRSIGSEKVTEARTYLRNFAIVGAVPWVIMGIGQLVGATPTIWHYFRPQDGNPFVLACLIVIFAASLLFAWWVFLRGGAKKVVEYNLMATLGQQGTNSPSENMIKLFAAFGVIILPVWVIMVVSMNAPLPR